MWQPASAGCPHFVDITMWQPAGAVCPHFEDITMWHPASAGCPHFGGHSTVTSYTGRGVFKGGTGAVNCFLCTSLTCDNGRTVLTDGKLRSLPSTLRATVTHGCRLARPPRGSDERPVVN